MSTNDACTAHTVLRQGCKGWIDGSRPYTGMAIATALTAALMSSGCGTVPEPGPVFDRGANTPTPPQSDAARSAATPTLARPRARWLPAAWDELPGWTTDRTAALWPALRASCVRPAPQWAAVCVRAQEFNPPDDAYAREFLERELQPYRVESPEGNASGLATGYFEPWVAARRQPQPGYTVPLYRLPAEVAARRPGWTRQQFDTLPAARRTLAGHEIAYVPSALDALLLQIQGSGRLLLRDSDGATRTVRLAWAGHNDQPYRSVGRWLIDQGELDADEASWPAIRAWADRARPERVQQMLWHNPRVVFFREEPVPADEGGPRGAQGVPLTAGRSVAVDPAAVPYGTVLWLDTTEPLSNTPLQRAVMAQDTGSAITGAVRVDYYWGGGPQAEQQAGRMKQPLRVWALWPRETVAAQQASGGPKAK
jgi:membrane-bound lytic murein transglycosylase A